MSKLSYSTACPSSFSFLLHSLFSLLKFQICFPVMKVMKKATLIPITAPAITSVW